MSLALDAVHIGLVSVSDRASSGVYIDLGLPALRDWLSGVVRNPVQFTERLIADERGGITSALRELCALGCDVVFTTGGTGPAPRDVTPEATLDLCAHGGREMPGFGEQMRAISLNFVPTAILSRQTAVVFGKTLVVNLPGQPKAIAETLGGLPQRQVKGIFAAVPYCVDLIGGAYIETDAQKCEVFRPKSALRPAKAH